jgi:hypothetical protein
MVFAPRKNWPSRSSLNELLAMMEALGYEGYALSLEKLGSTYTRKLSPFERQDWAIDAVWLRPEHCAPRTSDWSDDTA